ncbi:hypothetical protein ACJZ2D_002004 [Fusarium nematophilum]
MGARFCNYRYSKKWTRADHDAKTYMNERIDAIPVLARSPRDSQVSSSAAREQSQNIQGEQSQNTQGEQDQNTQGRQGQNTQGGQGQNTQGEQGRNTQGAQSQAQASQDPHRERRSTT